MQGPPASNRRYRSCHISSQGVPSHVCPYIKPEFQQHKNMVWLLCRFGFRGNYELYFELSRLGSADSGSLLCQPVSGNMTPIGQTEISMSVAFPTHVWKMANICKHIIVWLFSHMCAFSHTYVSKSKHVWKIAPRCKYTNVFGFFQTCWIKVKHLPKLTCVVFYTQVWLFSNIFAKSQTCVEKTIMFH